MPTEYPREVSGVGTRIAFAAILAAAAGACSLERTGLAARDGQAVDAIAPGDDAGDAPFVPPDAPGVDVPFVDDAGTCPAGFGDCNMNPADGCETDLSTVTACGSCATPCPARANATAICSGGACVYSCLGGFDDCNGAIDDGCEANLSSAATCGSCTTMCAAGQECAAGGCTSACDSTCDTCGAGCCREPRCVGSCTETCPSMPGDPCGCSYDCTNNPSRCQFACGGGSSCTIDCTDANDCYPTCTGGSACDIDCTRAADCRVECTGMGTQCIVSCDGADRCQFDSCVRGEMTCASGHIVCNRPCP